MAETSIPGVPIPNFTLNKLLTIAGEERQGIMSECIVIDSKTHARPFNMPCRIDAFIIGICTQGASTISSGLKDHHIRKGMIFFYSPQDILHIQTTENFRSYVLIVSPNLLREINIDSKRILPQMLRYAPLPYFEVNPAESESMSNLISMIDREMQCPESKFTRDIVCSLIAAAIYKFINIGSNYFSEHPQAGASEHNRANEYFKHFIELLGTNFKQERSVGFYAQQLCITPKYLTTLIRRISGKSVSDWINHYVIVEAKTLLRYSEMSIQEIAYYLNFPNQSFFGSYFKRNTGMSPSAFRLQKHTGTEGGGPASEQE